MDVSQAKTRFFKRDSTKADNLTLHAHKEREFWIWISSWAIFLQRPSDLGFSDEGYSLPATEVHWHELPSDHNDAGHEPSGGGSGARAGPPPLGVTHAAKEKRESLGARRRKNERDSIGARPPAIHRVVRPKCGTKSNRPRTGVPWSVLLFFGWIATSRHSRRIN